MFIYLQSYSYVIVGFKSSTIYNKIFSDLSDVEIPLERLCINTELGEGMIDDYETVIYYST